MIRRIQALITILRKTDVALIVLLLLFAGAFYFLFSSRGGMGNTVTISVDGAIYAVLPLSENAEMDIRLADGTHTNTLLIQGGEAHMTYADCPDGICLKHRPVRLAGEMIVCLPNRIIVEISGRASVYDAIAG